MDACPVGASEFLSPAERRLLCSLLQLPPKIVAARCGVARRSLYDRVHGIARRLETAGYDAAPVRALLGRRRATRPASHLLGLDHDQARDLYGTSACHPAEVSRDRLRRSQRTLAGVRRGG